MAGVKVGEMFFEIVGRDAKFKRTLDRAEGAAKKLSRRLGDIGSKLTRGLTLPLAGVAGAALKMSTDFNKAMSNVGSLLPGNTERVRELKRAVQDMAIATGQATGDLANGMYQLISAFGDTADTAQMLEINAKAAAVGVSTVADAINLTSAVTKAYGDTTAVAVQHVADLALKTVELGQTTFPELAASIGGVTPLAKELGVSQEELFGVMATLTGITGGAAEVSTQFASALTALMNPSADLTRVLGELGFASGAAMVEAEGFGGAIKLIADTAAAADIPLMKLLGRKEATILALALAGEQADTYSQKLRAMGSAAGTADKGFDELMEGVNSTGFTLDQLKQVGTVAMQDLGDAIAKALDPETVRDLKESVEGLTKAFGELDPETQANIIKFGALLAVLGPVTTALSLLISTGGKVVAAFKGIVSAGGIVVGFLGGPITIALTALAATAIVAFDQITERGDGFWSWFVDGWRATGRGITQAAANASQRLQVTWQFFLDWWSGAGQTILGTCDAIASFFEGMASDAVGAARRLYTGAKSWLVDKWGQIVAGVQRQIDRVKAAFRGLYQAVVGGSYVPDMVTEVKAWMERLGSDALVDPATAATKEAAEAFKRFNADIKRTIADLGTALATSQWWAEITGDQWGAMATEAQMLEGRIKSLKSQGLDPQGPVLSELVARWEMLTASVEGHTAAQAHARQETERMTEAQRAQQDAIQNFVGSGGLAPAGAEQTMMRVWGEESWRDAVLAVRDTVRRTVADAGAFDGTLARELDTFGNVIRQNIAGPGAFDDSRWQGLWENFGIVEDSTENTGRNLEDWNDSLSQARQWMFRLGIEADSFLGRAANAAQLFLDFGGGLGGLAAGLSNLLGFSPVDAARGVVRGIGKGLEGIWQGLTGWLADGGTTRVPGRFLVGEKGPEIVNLPRAATVEPLGMSRGSGGVGRQRIEIPLHLNGREVARAVVPDLAKELRQRGVTR